MSLFRLLYRSEIAMPETGEALDARIADICGRAQAKNRSARLSGALMIVPGTFIQALEGPPAAVEEAFERICCDLRHRNVRLLELVQVRERVFGDWSMALVTPGREIAMLGVTLGSVAAARAETSASASATIQMMRTLLATGVERPPASPGAEQASRAM